MVDGQSRRRGPDSSSETLGAGAPLLLTWVWQRNGALPSPSLKSLLHSLSGPIRCETDQGIASASWGLSSHLFCPFFGSLAPDHSALSAARTLFVDVEERGPEAMDVKERKPYRSLTRRRDAERRYTSSSADSEEGKAPQKSYSSSETLKAYDQDARLAYGGRVKDMVPQEAEEFCRAGEGDRGGAGGRCAPGRVGTWAREHVRRREGGTQVSAGPRLLRLLDLVRACR